MATVKRIYQKVGIDEPKVENLLGITCTITYNDVSTIEVEYDDATPGITDTLDDLMQQQGCVFGGPITELETVFRYSASELLSPNNADWAVNALDALAADSNNAAPSRAKNP